MVWITAHAGAGKTTLLASYLDTRHDPSLWCRFDRDDQDIASFYQVIADAAQLLVPFARDELPRLERDTRTKLASFHRRFFTSLVALLPPGTRIVFDDFQVLSADHPVHPHLVESVLELAPGLQILVASRALPPAAYARPQTHGELALLGANELKLDDEECLAIANLRLGASPDRQRCLELNRLVDGWAAALVLSLDANEMGSARGHGRRVAGESPDEAWSRFSSLDSSALFDYLAREVFADAPETTQQFLLELALLPWVDASLAAAVSGRSDAEERLHSTAAYLGLFTAERVTNDAETIRFRLHPLYRGFLLRELDRRLSPSELARLHATTAEQLYARHEVDEAIAIAIRGSQWAQAASWILQHAAQRLGRCNDRVVIDWIDALPTQLLQRAPWLRYWKAVALQYVDAGLALDMLDDTFEAFEGLADIKGMALAIAAAIDNVAYESKDFSLLDPWIARAHELERDHGETLDSLPTEIWGRFSVALFVALMFRRPAHPTIEDAADRAWKALINARSSRFRAYAGAMLVVYECWWRGDLSKAELCLQAVRASLEQDTIAPTCELVAATAEAGLLWNRGQHTACVEIVDVVLTRSDELGYQGLAAIAYTFGLSSALSSGDFETASLFLDRMNASLSFDASIDAYLYFHGRAWLAWMQGDRAAALANAGLAAELAERAGCPYHRTTALNDYGRLLVLEGEAERGKKMLQRAYESAEQIGGAILLYLTHRSLAVVALHEGDSVSCVDHLQQALAIARAHGLRDHTWWCPREMAELYAVALEHGIETQYVAEMIRIRDITPPERAAVPQGWPMPVRVRIFGDFELDVAASGARPMATKGAKRPRELLQTIAILGGENVSTRELEDTLWPNAAGEKAYRSLAVSVQRLRNLLGSKDSIRMVGERVSLNRRSIWLDAWALDRELKRPPASLDQRYDALALYRGPIAGRAALSGTLLHARNAWHARYLRAVSSLGADLEDAARWQDALHLYERALLCDPLDEGLYRGQIRCLLHMDEQTAAQRVYRRCEEALSAINTKPSHRTRELLDELATSPQEARS